MQGGDGVAAELEAAEEELSAAVAALRAAQAHWATPRLGGRTWDPRVAARALDEAEARIRAARERLERLAGATRRPSGPRRRRGSEA